MTTIAYDGKTIAYDSRSTSGIKIGSDNLNKRYRKNRVVFFLSGSVGDEESIAELWESGETESELDFHAFVVDDSGIWVFGGDSEAEVFRFRVERYERYAIGSGRDHAITAMDLGCDAKTAVKMAAKRDCCTGGKIRTYRVRK